MEVCRNINKQFSTTNPVGILHDILGRYGQDPNIGSLYFSDKLLYRYESTSNVVISVIGSIPLLGIKIVV